VSLDPIAIPRGRYRTLLQELRRGAEVCAEVAQLRLKLGGLVTRLAATEPATVDELKHAIKSCEDVARLRVELLAMDRYLREFDLESTPLRPPSRTDIQAAFESSVEFAQGKKKPEKND
jgi:hypothetical protein